MTAAQAQGNLSNLAALASVFPDGTISAQDGGFLSVAHPSTGVYQYTLARPIDIARFMPIVTPASASARIYSISIYSSTLVVVSFFDAAGVAADSAHWLAVNTY